MFRYNLILTIVFLAKFYSRIAKGEQCSTRDTCTNSSLQSPSIYNDEVFIQSRNCFCDSFCEEYGDCCHPTKPSINNYECVDYLSPTSRSQIYPFNRLSVWMRTECLSIYVGSLVDAECRNLRNETFNSNPILFIPVTSLQTNITYRNYYCAFCNNDANDDIQFWQYKPFCHGNGSDYDYLTINNEQDVEYYVHNLTNNCLKTIVYPHGRKSSLPSVFIRPCKKALPAICPVNTPVDLAQNCSLSGTAYRYVEDSSIIYKNPYCAECQHRNALNETTCADPYLRLSKLPISLIRVYPLSILFDPNLLKRYLYNNSVPSFIYSTSYNCSVSNEYYDLIERKCSKLTNSNQEIIISLRCSYPVQATIQVGDKIYSNNGSIYLVNHTILLRKDEYVFIGNNTIVFCADQWKNLTSVPAITSSASFYRNVLSIICTSISLGCLLVFCIVFWLMPSLHNLPGKCLLFLSISLFIGQLTFISTPDLTKYHSVCVLFGILIHYFYLSSFFWLLIISIHIHSTFHHQMLQQEKHDKQCSRLIAYNILVCCSAGIFILIGCILQYTVPQSRYSPGYGLIYCSISNANALIIFFLVPIGCILTTVAILFLKTLLAIYRSHKIAKLVNEAAASNKKMHNLVYVYARLSSLMGMQWILLVMALAVGQTWLWVIFEIINSMPGLFICFGFLCSKRTFKILQQKLSMQLIVRRQSSRSNTTTSTILRSSASPKMNTSKNFRF